LRSPEPYKGKGIRYEGEHIALKAGKSFVGGAGGAKK
jgi:ribosomal protein L6P/L9E